MVKAKVNTLRKDSPFLTRRSLITLSYLSAHFNSKKWNDCGENKLLFLGYSLESKDELVDALPTLKQRAAQDDANILFSVASDLAKVKQNLTVLNSPFAQ